MGNRCIKFFKEELCVICDKSEDLLKKLESFSDKGANPSNKLIHKLRLCNSCVYSLYSNNTSARLSK